MNHQRSNPLIKDSVTALRRELDASLVAVVLYGSRARDEAHAESDWDLLVIARNLPSSRLARHVLLKRMLPDRHRARVSLLAMTPEEFDAPNYVPSHYLDIALDGQVLYDPGSHLRRRIDALKQLIVDTGLRRQHVPWGDVWKPRGGEHVPRALPWHATAHVDG